MNHNKIARLRRGATALRQQFAQQPGSVFSRVLGERDIAVAVAPHVKDYRERIYPPLDTLRLFVGQVLSPDCACQDVVGRRLSERVAQGKSASTLNTGSYCDAPNNRGQTTIILYMIFVASTVKALFRAEN